MTAAKTQEFTKRVLNHMRERLSDYQEQYGDLYNLEATPAESTAFRFAKHDLKHHPDIITAGKGGEAPYYTNSSHLPVGYTADIFEALDIQDELQTLYTSGTVFHGFLGEKLPSWKSAATLVRKIAENYKLPYYTLSPTYSVCKTHGYIAGEEYTCPECGATTEVYSRITGYYRPVQNWNDGKSQEYKERKVYDVENSMKNADFSKKADNANAPAESAEAECSAVNGVLLFATKTCPNCKAAMKFLDEAGVAYEKRYVEDEKELATSLGLKQAPTLVVSGENGIEKYAGIPGVKEYLKKIK
jgi:ribonucleoside-triphosphate reductase